MQARPYAQHALGPSLGVQAPCAQGVQGPKAQQKPFRPTVPTATVILVIFPGFKKVFLVKLHLIVLPHRFLPYQPGTVLDLSVTLSRDCACNPYKKR